MDLQDKRIAVYGCGSMGTVVGALLAKGGLLSDMVDVYKEHVDALNEKGATLIGHEDLTVPVRAMLPEQMSGIYDLIILLCKQTANEEAFKTIRPHVDEHTTILTIQNGVPEPSVAKAFSEEQVVGGTILWGATFAGPGVSEVTEPLDKKPLLFEIGSMNGELNDRVHFVKEVLSVIGPTKETTQLMYARWSKVTANACVSGMSAALGATFGQLLDSTEAMEIIGQAAYEAGLVNEACGMKFAPMGGIDVERMFKMGMATKEIVSKQIIPALYANMRDAKASMLQDLEKGKLTEVDLINGYICSEGRKHGIDTPANDMIVEVVHGIEQGRYPLDFSNIERFDI